MVAVTHALVDSRPAHEGHMNAIGSPEVSRRTFDVKTAKALAADLVGLLRQADEVIHP